MGPEQSNDYRVVTFGSGGVGKSSLGTKQYIKKVMRRQTARRGEQICYFTPARHFADAHFASPTQTRWNSLRSRGLFSTMAQAPLTS